MLASVDPRPADHQSSRLPTWLILLVFAYGFWHLTWYWTTPLGRVAVLDEQENLQLAVQVATGTLPSEPFYRGMVYPALLSPLPALGLRGEDLVRGATFLGLLLHLVGSVLCGQIARRWFAQPMAGAVAFALYGFNPVLVHYATQILDGAFANVLLLLGLKLLWRADSPKPATAAFAAASLCWALLGLTRPQLTPVWLALLPLIVLCSDSGSLSARVVVRRGAAVLATGAAVFLAQGLAQRAVSGEFRLMPWQGPYNLWAANHPGANGRYFAQTVYLPPGAPHENPARTESIVLYQQATGQSEWDIDSLNRYWSGRLWNVLREAPLDVVGVLLRKAYYLANHVEQYNNKTYRFHQQRSPALRFNPLGWAWVGLLSLCGLTVLYTWRDHRRIIGWLGVVGLATAGVLTGYVSARFRIPLVALLTPVAGGVVLFPAALRALPRRSGLVWGGVATAFLALSFSRSFDVSDPRTYLQDHLLVASAAEQVGEDHVTWREANAALELSPHRPDALAMAVTSYFNLLLHDAAPEKDAARWVGRARQLMATPAPLRRAETDVVAAYALWRADDAAQAQLVLERALVAAPHLAGEIHSAATLLGFSSAPLATPEGLWSKLAWVRAHPSADAVWPGARVAERRRWDQHLQRLFGSGAGRRGAPKEIPNE